MKIEDYRKSDTFGNIRNGECFEYEGDIYMKVTNRIDGEARNAVDLECGILMTNDNDDVVRRVAAKVVID